MKLSEVLTAYEKKYDIFISFEVCHVQLYHLEVLALGMEHYQHHAPACIRHKTVDESRLCSNEKCIVLQSCTEYRTAFFRTCRYGVRELVQPVYSGNILLGVFFLNGKEESILKHVAAFLHEYLLLACSGLKDEMLSHFHPGAFYRENCRLFIDRHYRENISLADLAEQLHVNANYLSGVLRRINGKTFRQLLNARRLEEACQWLKFRKEFSIAQIAYHCGFQDKNYFSTVFLKAVGMPPGEYRRRFENGTLPPDDPGVC